MTHARSAVSGRSQNWRSPTTTATTMSPTDPAESRPSGRRINNAEIEDRMLALDVALRAKVVEPSWDAAMRKAHRLSVREIAADERFSDEFVGMVFRADVATNGFRSDAAEWLAQASRVPWWLALRRRRYVCGALASAHAADVWERVSTRSDDLEDATSDN